jgi:hypothetical protein
LLSITALYPADGHGRLSCSGVTVGDREKQNTFAVQVLTVAHLSYKLAISPRSEPFPIRTRLLNNLPPQNHRLALDNLKCILHRASLTLFNPLRMRT